MEYDLFMSDPILEEELIDIAKTMKSSRLLKRFIIENSDEDFLLKKLAYKKSNLSKDWIFYIKVRFKCE